MKIEYWIIMDRDTGDPAIQGAKLTLEDQLFVPTSPLILCFGESPEHLQFPIEESFYDPIKQEGTVNLSCDAYFVEEDGKSNEESLALFRQDMMELQSKGWLVVSLDDLCTGPKSEERRKSH
jgi:hypothetical protein